MTDPISQADRARNLAYRKPLVRDLNIDTITENTYNWVEELSDIKYFTEEDENLISSMLGDEDEAYEFQMMFNGLCADAERFLEDLQENSFMIPDSFDGWFCAMNAGSDFGGYMGYDSYEEDYVRLEYEDFVESEAGKKIEKMTKKDIINNAKMCFKILISYLSIKTRYEDLSCAFDVLRGKNREYLKLIKELLDLYEETQKNDIVADENLLKKYERKLEYLPEEVWLF